MLQHDNHAIIMNIIKLFDYKIIDYKIIDYKIFNNKLNNFQEFFK
jgi:hypothetical protein